MTTLSPIAPVSPITPEDLLEMPNSVDYELVDGKLVERNMGMESSLIAGRIMVLFGIFMKEAQLGHLFPADTGYQCFADDPGKVRKPDVSFIHKSRLPSQRIPKGYCLLVPDLVVEVISPNDRVDEVEEKIAEYQTAGVPLIWIVHPNTRTVQIRRLTSSPSGVITRLTESNTITGEDVLPGFSCPVAAFFE